MQNNGLNAPDLTLHVLTVGGASPRRRIQQAERKQRGAELKIEVQRVTAASAAARTGRRKSGCATSSDRTTYTMVPSKAEERRADDGSRFMAPVLCVRRPY